MPGAMHARQRDSRRRRRLRFRVVVSIGVLGLLLAAACGPPSHHRDDDWGEKSALEPEITGDNDKDEARWRHELDSDPWGDDSDLLTDDPPIVAVNANAGNPHYEPHASRPVPIREGDLVLLDVWGKKNTPGAVYYDITWMGFVGGTPSHRIAEVFTIVRYARDAGGKTVLDAINSGRRIAGWEVDRSTRGHIQKAGYGDYFIHRTGHSIGTDVHSNGANMDDLEIHDERQILPNSCFSIEPGIYLPEFGVRSEVNVLVRAKSAEVTGKIQREIVTI